MPWQEGWRCTRNWESTQLTQTGIFHKILIFFFFFWCCQPSEICTSVKHKTQQRNSWCCGEQSASTVWWLCWGQEWDFETEVSLAVFLAIFPFSQCPGPLWSHTPKVGSAKLGTAVTWFAWNQWPCYNSLFGGGFTFPQLLWKGIIFMDLSSGSFQEAGKCCHLPVEDVPWLHNTQPWGLTSLSAPEKRVELRSLDL